MSAPRLRLFHYWRSSCSWRVRWALALKGIPFESVAVNLLDDSTQTPEHLARNPMGYVPVLERLDAQGPFQFIGESVAMIEWLDEIAPRPSLFQPTGGPLHGSGDAAAWRARARQLAELVNAGTQPLQNLNILDFVADHYTLAKPAEKGVSDAKKTWARQWIRQGLHAYEELVRESAGRFSLGDTPTYPDLFLIPQVYNAIRYELDVAEFPLCKRIYEAALEEPTCIAAHPDRYAPAAN